MNRYLVVLSLFVVLIVGAPASSFAKGKSEVLVLGTLHQFHETTRGYSFADLSRIIETIKPDVLAVELTPDALENRTEQKTKQEYQRSVFSLMEKHGYSAVPMEPAEPEYSRLVGMLRESNTELREKAPQKSEAFSVYSNQLYEYLFAKWTSAAAVNSPETDALFEVKHEFQNALFGPKEEAAWNGWNSHFLKQIHAAAKKHPGKRILVLVGVEHTYWLRKELKASKEVRYVSLGRYLK
ncbi:MAG: hypothetical protein KF831_06620 [Acidobacteria bacterium]|nr:hypothetical protein [Acidobacteriota bacterium]